MTKTNPKKTLKQTLSSILNQRIINDELDSDPDLNVLKLNALENIQDLIEMLEHSKDELRLNRIESTKNILHNIELELSKTKFRMNAYFS